MKVIDEAEIRLDIEKSRSAQTKTEWWWYKLSQSGAMPVDETIQASWDIIGPQNLKELRSLMGALIQMNRFLPNLMKQSAVLRPLLRKNINGIEVMKRKTHFKRWRKNCKNTYIKYFRSNQPMRIACNASREGLLGVLQQLAEEGWQATHFASRFLTRF